MAYHERELLVSRSPVQRQRQQQQTRAQRTFNNHNIRSFPSRLSASQSLRVECKTDEQHFINHHRLPSSQITSPVKPIRFTMDDRVSPVHFRSQIIVHNHPDTDVHIKSLRVAFHCYDESPNDALLNRHSAPSARSRSPYLPDSSSQTHAQRQTTSDLITAGQSAGSSQSHSQALLHRWIDDICANEQLMANDDIVFFIKNGEFFARI
jgi:hypothetical protein